MYCKKRKVISIILLILSILFVILGLLIRLKNAQSPHADFRLLDEETQVVNATTYIDASLPESSMSGGTIAHSGEATYNKSSGKLSFVFENIGSEENDTVISLIYGDATLWQSGLICSGTGLSPEVDVDIDLDVGVYYCTLLVDNYNHTTGEKSVFSLTADVKLIVDNDIKHTATVLDE